MIHACGEDSGGHSTRRICSAAVLASGLALAASPTFALLAVLNYAMGNESVQVLCSAAGSSPFSGMTTMYLTMSAFHLSPWLRLILAQQGSSSGLRRQHGTEPPVRG